MARFEEVWERGRVVIRRVGVRGSAARKEVGLVAKALETLRAAPVRRAPSVDQVMRLDGRAMETAAAALEDSRRAWRVFDAQRYSGAVKVDAVLRATLLRKDGK